MMAPVPDTTLATATFLFTDIEGSTELLRSHRDEYASILADHHRILREAFTARGGKEVDNQGDAFFAAFTRAKDAVLAAADIQHALVTHTWPGGATVRVRMGIHTGEAELTADRYVGMSVHRAARISALGHGGQILVSATTAGLLDDEGRLAGVKLRDLGQYRLKDIERPVEIYQLDVEGLRTSFPPLKSAPREPSRRRRIGLAVAGLLVLATGGVALLWVSRDEPPPKVLPNSLVRIDPETLQPTQVVSVGDAPDLVLVAGGFVWITHYILRDEGSGEDSELLRSAGDRTLTRVDPATGDAVVVGGGLAPCGLTADPSGDVWVANCFTSGSGTSANVVRIDARSLRFEETWPIPSAGRGSYFRGLVYGGGALWVSIPRPGVARVDPRTGEQRLISLAQGVGALAWSDGYGDLWGNSFARGSLSRMHAATEAVETVESVAVNPVSPKVAGDTVWVGDWSVSQVVRLRVVGPSRPHRISLPVTKPLMNSSVWSVATGAGAVWATTPLDGALWRIDPATNDVTRIPMAYLPSGVAAVDGAVWVTVRGARSRS